MSPTVLRVGGYRFFFFSREEARPHIHVRAGDGEAKVWLEPGVEVARHRGLTDRQIAEVREIIEARREEIRDAWRRHFGR